MVTDRIHIPAITETCFTPDDEQLLNDITPEGYTIDNASRDYRRGGGVAILAELCYKLCVYQTLTYASFEAISVKLSMKKTH